MFAQPCRKSKGMDGAIKTLPSPEASTVHDAGSRGALQDTKLED